MFIAQSWEKGVLNKFGSNVGRLPIFQRVMRYLKTEGSATLVLDCILKLGGHAFFRGGFFSETRVLAFTPVGPDQVGGRRSWHAPRVPRRCTGRMGRRESRNARSS